MIDMLHLYILLVVMMMPVQSSTVDDSSHGCNRYDDIRWLVDFCMARWF
jgi:hypothetical protein